MVETRSERVERLFGTLDEVRATAESGDGLVEATTDHRGVLRRLRLDPRVYRELTVDELARAVVSTAGSAADCAHRVASDVLAQVTPGRRLPADTDLTFGPLLDELDRLIAAPPRATPADESLPVLGPPVDYAAMRRTVVGLRTAVSDLAGTADSDDGLITATTDGRGRLRRLRIDERAYRSTDSGRLAADLVTTARAAAAAAAREFGAASATAWSGAWR